MSTNSWRARLADVSDLSEAKALFEELLAENERLRSALEAARAAHETRTSASSNTGPSFRDLASSRASVLDTRQVTETLMLITISAAGQAKRTPINRYSRQRRGGIGIFDLRAADTDEARFLAIADQADALLLLSASGRVYRVAIADIPEASDPRSRGDDILVAAHMDANDKLAAVLPMSEADQQRYVLLGSQNGFIKRMRGHYFGSSFEPGRVVLDPRQTGGAASAMCLSSGTADVLMVSRGGMATRFNISVAPLQAAPGLKLRPGDTLAGLAAIHEPDQVFVVTEDGLGTRRTMEGFAANKAPGAAGKIIMKSEVVAGIVRAPDSADLVVLTRFSKLIRFTAEEVPAKTAPVQGVDIVELRGDIVTAAASID
ncbi:MAG: DNA gyrase C-terminal beta-propeller domain-containing protein [Anaerolineae bacterium]